MRTHVEFRSESLRDADAVDGKARGESVARLLANELPKHGYEIIEVAPEDWGWRVLLRSKAFSIWIGCGHYEEYRDGYLCFIEPSKPYVGRWLKRIATSEATEPLANAIEQVLCASSAVSNIRWWTARETTLGIS
jgi:hypothetical protein